MSDGIPNKGLSGDFSARYRNLACVHPSHSKIFSAASCENGKSKKVLLCELVIRNKVSIKINVD